MIQPLLNLFAADCQKGSGFFGLHPWYYYLSNDHFDGACHISKFTFLPPDASNSGDVPLVLLAVVDDLLRMAGLVAVGLVIYGGIRMITSEGDPEGTARARTIVTNALVGLVIAIVAAVFVSFLGNKLGG